MDPEAVRYWATQRVLATLPEGFLTRGSERGPVQAFEDAVVADAVVALLKVRGIHMKNMSLKPCPVQT